MGELGIMGARSNTNVRRTDTYKPFRIDQTKEDVKSGESEAERETIGNSRKLLSGNDEHLVFGLTSQFFKFQLEYVGEKRNTNAGGQ